MLGDIIIKSCEASSTDVIAAPGKEMGVLSLMDFREIFGKLLSSQRLLINTATVVVLETLDCKCVAILCPKTFEHQVYNLKKFRIPYL